MSALVLVAIWIAIIAAVLAFLAGAKSLNDRAEPRAELDRGDCQ